MGDGPDSHRDATETTPDPPQQANPESTGPQPPAAVADGDTRPGHLRFLRTRAASPLTLVAAALAVIAAVGAGGFGWSWWHAAHDDALRYSQTRDEVLRAGEQGIVNLNTLNYRTAEKGITIWERSTTGNLHDQLVAGTKNFLTKVAQAKTVTTAKALDSAVVELDARAGKASVIVALRITVTDPNGNPTGKRERLQGQLTRTRSGWRLSAVGQVPVAATSN